MGSTHGHYRCVRYYINKTNKERITNTAQFIPRNIPIPNENIDTHLARTADDLLHLLNNNRSLINIQTLNTVKGALIKIAELLQRDTTPQLTPILVETPKNTEVIEDMVNVQVSTTEVPVTVNTAMVPSSEGGNNITSQSHHKTK